jgi:ABC-2 type transport system ATP-binding protein
VIKDEIFSLARNGATIIFSTHRMEQVEEICDHIVLVNKGKKILDATVKEAKQQFKESLFRIAFNGEPVGVEHPSYSIIKKEKAAMVVKIAEGFTSNDVLHALLNQGGAITSYNEILPSLNDIFIELVEGTPAARQFQKVTS